MAAGDRFAVAVTQKLAGNAGYAVVYNANYNKLYADLYAAITGKSLTGYYKGVVNKGESYLITDDETTDWADFVKEMQGDSTTVDFYNVSAACDDYDNLPIRAYSDPGVDEDTNLANAQVTVKATAKTTTYTGEECKPGVEVSLLGKTLTEGTDYAVSYSDNIEVGTATVTVSGRGDFCGTASATFAISKASQPIKAAATSARVRVVSGGKADLAAIYKVSAPGKVTFALKKNVAKLKLTKKGILKVDKKFAPGTYALKVIATAAATKNYNAASKKLTLKLVVS